MRQSKSKSTETNNSEKEELREVTREKGQISFREALKKVVSKKPEKKAK